MLITELPINQILCGNCVEVMKEFPDESIDLVITSPPFNLGKTHHTGNFRHSPYPDDLPEETYQQRQTKILNILFRVTKHNGSLFYQHKNRIRKGISITPYEWILKTKWLIKQEIVWFNRSQNFDKCRFYPMTERIYWLAKSPKTKLYNHVNKHDLWKIQSVGTKKTHTRSYPEELVENIIKCFDTAEIILDPFVGSGTTCVVAQKLGRKWIGIDLKREYCEMAKKRLMKECSQKLSKFMDG